MDLSDDSVAILDFTVSSRYYGMFRGQTGMYLPPKHSINSFFKVAAPSPKGPLGPWLRDILVAAVSQTRF